jgi:hypothetical protein
LKPHPADLETQPNRPPLTPAAATAIATAVIHRPFFMQRIPT